MALTLIVNPGSSSKKYALIEDGRTLVTMRFEQTAGAVELCTVRDNQQQKCEGITQDEYISAIRQVLDTALREKIIANLQNITRVGIRIVAPGSFFQQHRVIDEEFMRMLRIREASAPTHIPATLREIELLQIELPHATLVGVSDSAFHSTLPPRARNYSIAREDAEELDIHRFGYHGLSYASVVRRLDTVLKNRPRRVIVCHIGSGASMMALLEGTSIDSSMGYSPASGLIMGSRAGDIESGALLEVMRGKNMNLFQTQTYLQTQCGLKGIAGEADFRHLLERLAQNEGSAIEAMDLFVYRFQKMLGSFMVALGGLDAIVLTATAVERSSVLRKLLLSNLEWTGIELDEAKNEITVAADGIISANQSKVAVALVRTNEQDEMLRITHNFT